MNLFDISLFLSMYYQARNDASKLAKENASFQIQLQQAKQAARNILSFIVDKHKLIDSADEARFRSLFDSNINELPLKDLLMPAFELLKTNNI